MPFAALTSLFGSPWYGLSRRAELVPSSVVMVDM
jgi:hypothetical protein